MGGLSLATLCALAACGGRGFESCEWHHERQPQNAPLVTQPNGTEKGWWSVDLWGATGTVYYVKVCSNGRRDAEAAAMALARKRGTVAVKLRRVPTEVAVDPACEEGEVSGECW